MMTHAYNFSTKVLRQEDDEFKLSLGFMESLPVELLAHSTTGHACLEGQNTRNLIVLIPCHHQDKFSDSGLLHGSPVRILVKKRQPMVLNSLLSWHKVDA